ncbi:arsenate reductase ArsC [Nocardia uniformis]|uniref:Arsenate reductase ArsC n=1 Tax=Nocardia uniformis TaxID=53432 RepID=A0A849C6M6_9NOCA|nr:arsenate reductase ArsC [Nocardia uniformis]
MTEHVEHDLSPGPAVLFVCTHNAGRSQMALGFFNHLVGGRATAWSGGSAPAAQINPLVVQAMSERGIDITAEYPKPWTDELVRAADVVIDMGCGDTDPIMSGHRYEQWPLPDPAGHDIEEIRAIRDQIEIRIRRLIGNLRLAPV